MPGANAPLALVRLDSTARFAIVGSFPAGFERIEAGGYAAAETFFVLDGRLEIGDLLAQQGQLVHVPAHAVRESMRTLTGCRVLAWFEGRPDFLPASELEPTSERAVVVDVTGVRDPRTLLDAAGHVWSLVRATDRPAESEAFDPDTGDWSRTAADWDGPPARRLIVRA